MNIQLLLFFFKGEWQPVFRCLWKWLYIKRKKTRKWKGMIFWSFHFYCYKHNDENIYKSCAMWKQARNEFKGQVRSWNLRPAHVTQKETGSGMSWGPELKPVAKVKHEMGEGVGGKLHLAGGTGPASANSCQGRRSYRCGCCLAPPGCLGPQWGQRGDYRCSGASPPARVSGVHLALSSFPVSMSNYSPKPEVGWQHQLR